jgi:cytoskeletal protein CcmA (bactofilin family)
MASTFIGSSITVDGEITTDDKLVVAGTVKGKIGAKQSVVIERSGVVSADVEAESVQIAGTVDGQVAARARVEITAEGKMSGDIRAPRILIADGAQFRGHIDMEP